MHPADQFIAFHDLVVQSGMSIDDVAARFGVSPLFVRQNSADAADQFRETRFAESLLNGVVRSVEDWAKPSFHRAGHRAFVMHLATHRKNSAFGFNRLVDLTEGYARCPEPETDAAVAAWAKSDQSLSIEGAYLASDDSAYVVGADFLIDGGDGQTRDFCNGNVTFSSLPNGF